MKLSFFQKIIEGNFVIIDSSFPQKEPFGFRNIEINEYFKVIKGAEAYAMCSMKPWGDAWFPWSYGVEESIFEENKKGYEDYYPENASKLSRLDENRKYRFKLAYSYFLAETYVLLPFYERNNIPFVFMLYPGGAFGLGNKASDAMLRRIASSPCFKKVIVSQTITQEYLLRESICDADKISYVYGGFAQFDKNEVKPKRYYKEHKNTIDICFVAAKYSEQGIDKGYDLFIETAKILVNRIPDSRFHVVGNFNDKDIPVGELGDKITFYGYQKKEFLLDFYSAMDIFLSPNRPGKLYEGNFDGFPMGVDAGFCGTAMFVSDELGMNTSFVNGKDIVIIPLNAEEIADDICLYYNDLEKLYVLSKECKKVSQRLFSMKTQINARLAIFNQVYQQEYGRELE